ncbi:hypothetical protein O7626_30650 [Micromonospora sp. WMMD1102]|nr:hypothetical protein [Micromonospora sp. WMMD1102]MDG4790232.1 hypothetical protein [Micromonospora sp. WMMD1102]
MLRMAGHVEVDKAALLLKPIGAVSFEAGLCAVDQPWNDEARGSA